MHTALEVFFAVLRESLNNPHFTSFINPFTPELKQHGVPDPELPETTLFVTVFISFQLHYL